MAMFYNVKMKWFVPTGQFSMHKSPTKDGLRWHWKVEVNV